MNDWNERMIDYSLIETVPAQESDREFSYQVLKAAMGKYITQVWGWDEKVEREYHALDWQKKIPKLILYDNQPIGTISLEEKTGCLEIGMFYILPEYQNKGIGSYLLEDILDNSDKAGSIVELEVLKVNPAVSLYQRYGFEIVDSNEHMYQMERKPGNAQ